MRNHPPSQSAREAGALLKYRLYHTDLVARYGLNDTQTEGLHALADQLLDGQSHLYIELSGGEGKTRMGLALIDALSAPDGTPIKTLVKTPTNVAGARFLKEATKVQSRLTKEGLIGQYNGKIKQPEKNIIVTTNMSHLRGHAKGVFRPGDIKLILSDEGHHQLAEGQIRVNDEYKDAIHISMTATPEYSAEKTLSNHFHKAYSKTLNQSIEHGRTTDYSNYMLMVSEIDISKVKKQAGDFNQKEMAKTIDEKVTYRQIAEMIESWIDPHTGKSILGRPTIAYVSTTRMAENANAFFNAYFKKRLKKNPEFKDLKSFSMTSHSANMDTENETNDKNFRAGKHLMMIAVRANAESMDYDRLSVCINITSTISKVYGRQRGLRILRQDDENPDKKGVVIDVMFRDKAKRALLFAEAAGDTTFFNAADKPDILANAFRNYWEVRTPQKASTESGPRVIAPNEIIRQYGMRVVTRSRVDFLTDVIPPDGDLKSGRRKVHNDLIAPAIREQMKAKNYLSIREIFNEIAMERGPDQPGLDYHKMLLPLTSTTNARNTTNEFREHCRPELEALQNKLGVDIYPMLPASKREGLYLHLGDILDYEDKVNMELTLPKIRAQMDKMGIDNIIDLFSLTQMEYPFRRFHERAFIETIQGLSPAINYYSGSSRQHRALQHVTLGLSRLFNTDPRDLFSEDQYFDLIEAYRKLLPGKNFILTESFGLYARTHEDNEFIGKPFKSSALMISLQEEGMRLGVRGWLTRVGDGPLIVTEPEDPPRWMRQVVPLPAPGEPSRAEMKLAAGG